MIIEDSKGNKFDVGEGSIILHYTETGFYKTTTDRLESALQAQFATYEKLCPERVVVKSNKPL